MTYAAVLAKTMGWELPRKERSIAFIRSHQRPDGHFVNLGGKHDPASDLGILYNTTRGSWACGLWARSPRSIHSPASSGCWPAMRTGSFPGTRPASSPPVCGS